MKQLLLGVFAAICIAMIAQNVIAHSGDAGAPVAAQSFDNGYQNSAAPSGTPLPDLNATNAASGFATMSAAQTQGAAEQTRSAALTRDAQTQIAGDITATAVMDQATIVAAQKTELAAGILILAETITAAPTQRWRNEYHWWATENALATEAQARATIDERERVQEDQLDRAAAAGYNLLLWGGPIMLLVILFMIGSAAAWLIKGQRGAQAQVIVDGARTIPGVSGGKPRELVTDGERAQLIAFVDQCREASGDDARRITPQSEFASKETWSVMVRLLTRMGLVTPERGSGNGTTLNGNLTLAGLALALRKGTTA